MKLIQLDETKSRLMHSLDQLTQMVSTTFGPHGRTVVLATSRYPEPRHTKDGISVAKNILLKDTVTTSMLTNALEKIDQKAGDGTTSATIFICDLLKQCYELQKEETLPNIRIMLNEALQDALKLLEKEVILPNKNQLLQVAITAANSSVLGKLIFDAIQHSDFCQVVESVEDSLEQTNGIQYDSGAITPLMARSTPLLKPIILASTAEISVNSQVKQALEKAFAEKRPLVIVAQDIKGEALSTLLANQLNNVIQCTAVRGFGYGNQREANIQDFVNILGLQKHETEDLWTGECKSALITTKSSFFETVPNDLHTTKLAKHINNLKQQLQQSDKSVYEKEILQQRVARYLQKASKIKVSTPEKRDRAVDALMTLKNAKISGIVKGSGNTLLKIASQLKNLLLKKSLEQIVSKLAENSGVSMLQVKEKFRENLEFNALSGKFGKVDVWDSAESIRQMLQVGVDTILEAISIGGIVEETEK